MTTRYRLILEGGELLGLYKSKTIAHRDGQHTGRARGVKTYTIERLVADCIEASQLFKVNPDESRVRPNNW